MTNAFLRPHLRKRRVPGPPVSEEVKDPRDVNNAGLKTVAERPRQLRDLNRDELGRLCRFCAVEGADASKGADQLSVMWVAHVDKIRMAAADKAENDYLASIPPHAYEQKQ